MLQEIRKKQLEDKIKLQDLTFIGSHDSGSVKGKFTLAGYAQGGAQIATRIIPHGAAGEDTWAARAVIPAAENWETQELSILGQIQAGARWFDLRFDEFDEEADHDDEDQCGEKEKIKKIRAYHGDGPVRMPAVPAEEVFEQIRAFCFDAEFREESQDQIFILNLRSTPEVAVELLQEYFSPGSGENDITLGNLLVSNKKWEAVESAAPTSSDQDRKTPLLASLTIADVKGSAGESQSAGLATTSSQHYTRPRIILYQAEKFNTHTIL